jgi:hypothetical protein
MAPSRRRRLPHPERGSGDHSPPLATPAPASSLNPGAPPFVLGEGSSSHPSGELAAWLAFSLSPPCLGKGKGKAPAAAPAPLPRAAGRNAPVPSSFMAAARRAPPPRPAPKADTN